MFLFALLACLSLALLLLAVARSSTVTSRMSVVRTFSGEGIGSDNTVTVDGLGTTTTLNAGTTPPVTLDACFDLPLVAGAASLDFTAMPDPNLNTINGTGKTPYQVMLQNPVTNANPISIAKGAANGYDGFGAIFEITLQPGEKITIEKAVAANVDATHKILDVTGTGTQILKVQAALG